MKEHIVRYIETPKNHFSLILVHMIFALMPIYIIAGILRFMGFGQLGLFHGSHIHIKEALLYIAFAPIFSFVLAIIFWLLYSIGNKIIRIIFKIYR